MEGYFPGSPPAGQLNMQEFGGKNWFLLGAASAGMFLSSLDFSVNVGLPDIAHDLDASLQSIYWIITVYIGATASLQLVVGRVADLYGLRRVYLVGLVAYGIAVSMIAFSPALESVLAFRWVQAIGNAIFLATSPALITAVFPARVRGTALGMMTAIGMGGMIVGSLGAGLVIDMLGWRWIFLGRVPLTLLALLLAVRALPVLTPEHRGTLDWSSATLLVTGFPVLLSVFYFARTLGWLSPATIGVSVLALAMCYRLVWRQLRAEQPLLDVAILRRTEVALGLIANFFLYLSIFVCWFILPFFTSEVVGASATVIGLLLALPALCLLVSSPLGGLLADKTNPALISTFGIMLVFAGLVSFLFFDQQTGVFEIAIRMAVLGVGMGVFQSSNLSLVMGGVNTSELGMGGALAGLSRNLGAMTSVAVLGSLFAVLQSGASDGATGVDGSALPSEAYIYAFRISYAVAAGLALVGTAVAASSWIAAIRQAQSGSE